MEPGKSGKFGFSEFRSNVWDKAWKQTGWLQKLIITVTATLSIAFAGLGIAASFVQGVRDVVGEYPALISFVLFAIILFPYLLWYSFQVCKEYHDKWQELVTPIVEIVAKDELGEWSDDGRNWRITVRHAKGNESVRCKVALVACTPFMSNLPMPLHCHNETRTEAEVKSEIELSPGEERRWSVIREQMRLSGVPGDSPSVRHRPFYSFAGPGFPPLVNNMMMHDDPFVIRIIVRAFVNKGASVEGNFEIQKDQTGTVIMKPVPVDVAGD
jgi:hypothetical protein